MAREPVMKVAESKGILEFEVHGEKIARLELRKLRPGVSNTMLANGIVAKIHQVAGPLRDPDSAGRIQTALKVLIDGAVPTKRDVWGPRQAHGSGRVPDIVTAYAQLQHISVPDARAELDALGPSDLAALRKQPEVVIAIEELKQDRSRRKIERLRAQHGAATNSSVEHGGLA